MLDIYCPHGRFTDNCEDCAFIRAQERGAPLGGPQPLDYRAALPAAAPPVLAQDDVVIPDEADPSRGTFVAAGTPVPAELVNRIPEKKRAS